MNCQAHCLHLVVALSVIAMSSCAIGPASPGENPIATASSARESTGNRSLQAGMNVLVYGRDAADLPTMNRFVQRMAWLHVDSVSVVIPLFQNGPTASRLLVDERTPSDGELRDLIRICRRAGLRVLMRPLLDEETLLRVGQWRGSIQPADRTGWFASYNELIRRYASLAEREHVDIFSVGSEFSSLEPDDVRWREVIGTARRNFSGKLIYSRNWDSHATLGFASLLDFLGIDAFYPLRVPADAQIEDLIEAWRPWVDEIQRAQSTSDQPVLITEIGIASRVGAYAEPWRGDLSGETNLESQRRDYAAACRALAGYVSGMYWWTTTLHPLTHPESDPGFDPTGKPAEEEIRTCFQ